MTDTDPRLEKLRTRLARVAEVAVDGRECPAPDTLWESARERLDRRTNEIVVMHIGVCGACAAAWRTASGVSRVRARLSSTDTCAPPDADPLLVGSGYHPQPSRSGGRATGSKVLNGRDTPRPGR